DLEGAITQKTFRQDLYYRLKVMTLRVPSLAERQEDIPLLLERLCAVSCQQYGLPALKISPLTERAATAVEWPGNIRQLEHPGEVAAISAAMEGRPTLEPPPLFPNEPRAQEGAGASLSSHMATRRFQKKLLADALEETNWNVSEAARRLELTRSHV